MERRDDLRHLHLTKMVSHRCNHPHRTKATSSTAKRRVFSLVRPVYQPSGLSPVISNDFHNLCNMWRSTSSGTTL